MICTQIYPNNISVVIPLYNKEKHIRRAIESVMAQTYPHFELVIVDDGSTDDSRGIAVHYTDPRIKIIAQENRGVSAARNRGCAKAENDWVAFLDADDEWMPDFLERITYLQFKYPVCDVFGTGYFMFKRDGKIELNRVSLPISYGWQGIIEDYFEAVQRDLPFNASSVAIRRDALSACGGFPESESLYEDHYLFMKLAKTSKIAYHYLPLSIYHQDSENRHWHFFPTYETKFISEGKRILSTLEETNSSKKQLYEYLVRSEIGRARALLYRGNFEIAREVLAFCKGSEKKFVEVTKLTRWVKKPKWCYRMFFKVKDRLKMLLRLLDKYA